MGNEIFLLSFKSSIFFFTTIALITQIAHIILLLLKPYFIRLTKNISLKYSQDIYFAGYIFLRNIVLFLSASIYSFIFITSVIFNIFNASFIFMQLGILLFIAYIISKIFIDYTKNLIFLNLSVGINIISIVLNLILYIQLIVNY